MSALWLLVLYFALAPPPLSAAQAVFSADGQRVWMVGADAGLGYLDLGDQEKTAAADRVIDVAKAGGPEEILGLALSKRGHLLLACAGRARIVYQTAADGLRRWWLLEKSTKPKLLREESD